MDSAVSLALLLLSIVIARAAEISQNQNEINSHEEEEGSENLKIITRLIKDCGEQEDPSVCFKMKAVSFLERLIRAPSEVPITDFMTLARDPSAPPPDNTPPATEKELDATLPRSLEEKSRKLDDLLWNKFSTLLTTRKLQMQLPTDLLDDAIGGRGHKGGGGKKKKGDMMCMIMMMKGMIMKGMMWGMAAMSWKGMMMAKMAMVMAGWMMMKKMAESHPPVMYGPPPEQPMGGGYYRRQQNDVQNMAYGSQPTVDY